MIKIITPEEFKEIPWKNGKGSTIELAINDGGSLDDFDWRISMASVVEDGAFSDFSGYMRNLVLIEGDGIDLQHEGLKVDRLDHLLSVATFDGGCKTAATLASGPITDFNVITKAKAYQTTVKTYTSRQEIRLEPCSVCFIYALNKPASLSSRDNSVSYLLPAGHLMQMVQADMGDLFLSGEGVVVVYLHAL